MSKASRVRDKRKAGRLRATIVVKTSEGATWILPHVDELLARGHDVSVIIPPGGGRLRAALALRSVTIVDSPFNFSFRSPLATVSGLLRLRRALRKTKADVVMYHLLASALAVRLSTLFMGVPRIHMVAGPLYLDSLFIRTAERVLARLDTLIIAGSDYTAARYRQLGFGSRIISIPYGVDVEGLVTSRSAGAEARRELDITESNFLAIMVAYVYAPKRLVHSGKGVKGHDVLLDAWARVRERRPDARLLIVGGGFDAAGEAYRHELSETHPLTPMGVIWLSTVADVRRYYAAADVSVSPSRSENHGAAVEAAALGVPSIVSDAGALPETVVPGSGWTFRSADSAGLADLIVAAARLKDAGRLVSMGDQARDHVVKNFDSRVNARKVVDCLEHLAGPHREGAKHDA